MFSLFVRIYRYTTMQKFIPTPELFNKFLENRINAAETDLLFTYFGAADDAELKLHILNALDQQVEYGLQNEEPRLAAIHDQLTEKIFSSSKPSVLHTLLYSRIAKIAAILITTVSISILVYHTTHTQNYVIVPGGPKAALTINGITKNLKGQKSAILFHKKGVTITTQADGTIVYAAYNADALTASKMNSLETPRGGEYRVTLSDGSVVNLNAGSKLSFPTGFRGAERKVTLEGEAFFEVAKNADMPFIVQVDGSSILVLGTKFNVSSYKEDNGITATLLEGSILFSDPYHHQVKLKPNQQINSQSGKLILKDVDATDDMAWTKGQFLFNNMPIASVMQKLGRWYNVDVDEQSLPDKNLYLKISRHANLTEVLKIISKATDMNFELKENTILLKK